MEHITQTDGEDIMTIEEAAQWFKVYRATLKRWIKSGKIEPIRIGNSYRVKKSEFYKHKYIPNDQ